MQPPEFPISEKIHAIAVPYDAGAAYPGPSTGAELLLKAQALPDAERLILRRSLGSNLRMQAQHLIHKNAVAGRKTIVFGGDHSITFFCLRALTSLYGKINVVHFDAHHDAYPGEDLSNYTVFYHAARLLPINLFGVGYRHEHPGQVSLPATVSGATYISLDLDFFSPKLTPSVGHGVPTRTDEEGSWENYLESIRKIEGPVIGADVVEWCPNVRTTENEKVFVQQAVAEIIEVLARC